MKTLITFIRQIVFMLAFIVLCSTAMNAQIFFDGSPGTDAPPPTLGGFTMVPFEDDNRPTFVTYPDVPLPAPYTGNLGFTPDLIHYKIGDGWSAWGHGYTGSVYFTGGGVNSMTFTLPPETRAFYFYSLPNTFGTYSMEATAQDGTTSGPISVTSSLAGEAKYFGFYTLGGVEISQIEVTAQTGTNGFAVGEFGIFVGPPSEPVAVPLSSWAFYLGIFLMISFVVIRFRRIV